MIYIMVKGNIKSNKQYIPVFTEKYCGKYPIYIKSSWEEKFCKWLDYNKDVIEWSSEPYRISYIDPTQGRNGYLDSISGKKRIYYPDFYVMFKNKKKFIIEIKPEKHTRMPKKKGKKSKKTMVERKRIYLVNTAKFESAKKFAKKLGMEFLVLTERELFRGK